MGAYDDSFNATGPTTVAFETVADNEPDWASLGVGAFGRRCGVNGVSMRNPQSGVHRDAPDLVGVHGLGETEGVQGEGLIGVHGKARVLGPSSGTGFGGRGPVGVVGDNADIGVRGAGETAGVVGFSKKNRGGIFHTGRRDVSGLEKFSSVPSAQLLLIPIEFLESVESQLPRNGHAGDLFAAVDMREARIATAELWFCVRSGSSNTSEPGAMWSKVQFSTTHTVA